MKHKAVHQRKKIGQPVKEEVSQVPEETKKQVKTGADRSKARRGRPAEYKMVIHPRKKIGQTPSEASHSPGETKTRPETSAAKPKGRRGRTPKGVQEKTQAPEEKIQPKTGVVMRHDVIHQRRKIGQAMPKTQTPEELETYGREMEG